MQVCNYGILYTYTPTHPMRQEMLLIRPESLSTSQGNKSEVELEPKTSASNCNTWATTCIGRRIVHNESYKRLNFIQLKSHVKTLPVLRITGRMSVANLLYLTGQIQAFLVTFQVQFTVIHVVWVHGHHISGRLSLQVSSEVLYCRHSISDITSSPD